MLLPASLLRRRCRVEEPADASERDLEPVGTIGGFVADLVQRFFKDEGGERRLERRVGLRHRRTASYGAAIGGNEPFRRFPPSARRRATPRTIEIGVQRSEVGRNRQQTLVLRPRATKLMARTTSQVPRPQISGPAPPAGAGPQFPATTTAATVIGS